MFVVLHLVYSRGHYFSSATIFLTSATYSLANSSPFGTPGKVGGCFQESHTSRRSLRYWRLNRRRACATSLISSSLGRNLPATKRQERDRGTVASRSDLSYASIAPPIKPDDRLSLTFLTGFEFPRKTLAKASARIAPKASSKIAWTEERNVSPLIFPSA